MPSRDDRHERKALLKLRTGFSETVFLSPCVSAVVQYPRGSLNTARFTGQFFCRARFAFEVLTSAWLGAVHGPGGGSEGQESSTNSHYPVCLAHDLLERQSLFF